MPLYWLGSFRLWATNLLQVSNFFSDIALGLDCTALIWIGFSLIPCDSNLASCMAVSAPHAILIIFAQSRISCGGCRDGAVVRALASHQCGPCSCESTYLPPMWAGSIPRLGVICGLSLLVVYPAPRGFLRVLRFPLSSNTNI